MTERGVVETGSMSMMGAAASREYRVSESDSATAVGSGDVSVLGTPVLLAWMEAVTCQAIADSLSPEETSVGWKIQLTHALPSPIGSTITVEGEVTAVDGKKVTFAVSAHDEQGRTVGQAEITRVIVDRKRFESSA
jgi:predicted thioesterase